MKRIKVALTGGHLTCALATISALRQKEPHVEIIFFGRKHSMEGDPTFSVEYKIVPSMQVKFLPLITGRLQRRLTRHTFLSLLKIPFGFLQAFFYLLLERPDVICSFGGYLSVPVVFSGWLLGIPSITHEQAVVPGLATKINSFFVKKVADSWFKTVKYFKHKHVVLTGNPIREEIFRTTASDSELKTFLNIVHADRHTPLLFVTGGNQGSHFINEVVGKILPLLLEKYFVIHQTGDSEIYQDYEKLRWQFVTLHSKRQNRYFLTKYIGPSDIGAVLHAADLVVSRAGANIISELLALQKPSILIPLPWAGGNEQRENAKLLESVGIAQVLDQEQCTPSSLVQSISQAIGNLENWRKNAPKAQSLIKKDASLRLAKEILSLTQGKN